MEIITESPEATCRFGARVGNYLKEDLKKRRISRVLALVGQLGSGKTTFVQCLAKSLGINKRVISPTFVIMQEYQKKNLRLYHIDLYRLTENVEEELQNLGIQELLGRRGNIVAIEWAEKAEKFLPKDTLWIRFEVLDDNKRKIVSNEAIY